MRPNLRRDLPAALTVLILLAPGMAAHGQEENELREFAVGMAAAALPPQGYAGFSCAAEPARELAGWSDWRSCPPDDAGLRAVRFRYDDRFSDLARIDEDEAGTKVGGHPVLLTLLIGDQAEVEGLQIETDPKARLYLRKKAFLFGRQVMARFGEEGWRCTESEPGSGEAPVGGVFIRQHCEKTTATRRYVLDRELFRREGEALKDFVGGTRLTILRAG